MRAVDNRWMDHIDAMDQLRDGIGLRAYAQRDPVNEYKMESFDMFDEMIHLIQEDAVRYLFMVRVERPQERKRVASELKENKSNTENSYGESRKPVTRAEKVGRNAPCPCGSGKKYKQCCGRNN